MTLTVATSGASGYNIEKVRSCFGPRELFAPLQFTKNLAKASSGPAVLKGGHVSGQNIETWERHGKPFSSGGGLMFALTFQRKPTKSCFRAWSVSRAENLSEEIDHAPLEAQLCA